MEVKDLFAAIEFLFVEVLFIPFDFIRLEISNWLFSKCYQLFSHTSYQWRSYLLDAPVVKV